MQHILFYVWILIEPRGSEGVQGEARGYQRGNSPKAKSWEAPSRYHFDLEDLVAVPLQVAIPNGEFHGL